MVQILIYPMMMRGWQLTRFPLSCTEVCGETDFLVMMAEAARYRQVQG